MVPCFIIPESDDDDDIQALFYTFPKPKNVVVLDTDTTDGPRKLKPIRKYIFKCFELFKMLI